VIVDASVAFKWMFVEQGSDAALALLDRADLCAPNLLLVELGNALWKKGVRGELGDQAAYSSQLSIVLSFVSIVKEADLVARAVEMALAIQHPIYDCIYLALAERSADKLVTADEKFFSKVAASDLRAFIEILG